MAPNAPPAKNVPAKNRTQRNDAQPKGVPGRGVKRKDKKEKINKKKQKMHVKRWLETPADWAKFDAWAKINALPRKTPEPELIVRPSKPLKQMKKRIEFLSKPQKKTESTCRTDLGVSKKALRAKPSKRIKILANFVEKKIDYGREFPIKISRAALRYKATKRIKEISKPHETYLPEHCKTLMDMTKDISKRKTVTRKTRLILARKAVECPELLTDEELDILMTPTGIHKSALTYKFTPWMKYLSLPSYRFLKDRNDEDATDWKNYILEENESRGKQALEEKRRRADKKNKDEGEASELIEKEKMERTNKQTGEDKEAQEKEEEKEKIDGDEEIPTVEGEDMKTKDAGEIKEPDESPEEKQVGSQEESSDGVEKNEAVDSKEDDEEAAKRKAAKNAWRFSPPPCKDDPFAIKRAALKGKISPRMAELAVPFVHEDRSSKKNPFAVKKSALTGPIPEGVVRLAKPNHPRDPIERPPPREKDSFGRPIYPMPPYGKKMPSVKPYEPAKCPDKEEKNEKQVDDEGKKKKPKKSGFIDPIIYEPTIDPCMDPERSKRQIAARKAAKEEFRRIKEAKEKMEKEPEMQTDVDK